MLIETFGNMQQVEEEADTESALLSLSAGTWSLHLKKRINEFIFHIKQLHAVSQHRLINGEL